MHIRRWLQFFPTAASAVAYSSQSSGSQYAVDSSGADYLASFSSNLEQGAICWSQERLRPEDHNQSLADRKSTQSAPEELQKVSKAHVEDQEEEDDDDDDEDVWKGPHECVGKYCVFSNRGLSRQGMALVTTKRQRRRVARMKENEDMSITTNTNKSNSSSHSHNAKFRVAEIPGRGNGVVANRAISRGESIMASKPALLVHWDVFRELELEDIYELLDSAVDRLPAARRESYLALATAMGGRKVADILFTNSFQISLGGDDEEEEDSFHYGTFPDVSRMNHDCRPNLAFHIDRNLTHHTHAVRDIRPGEELTVSYVDPFQARAVRREQTRSAFGFECGCSSCGLPEAESRASDARLLSVSRLERELSDFDSPVASPATIEQLLALYDEERLHFKLAGAYTLAALNYNLFGRAGLAAKYAHLAADAVVLEHGPDAADVGSMRELAADPKAHWSWNLRPRR